MDYTKILSEKKSASSWNRVPPKPYHGVCTPLFSLKSSHSEGIGDFYDLFSFLDWLQKAGMNLVQLLPVNDTGFHSSPYSAESAFALDPVYLRINALFGIQENPKWKKKGEALRKSLQKTNSFFTVKKKKLLFLYEYFLFFYSTLSQKKSYQDFVAKNSWLTEYSLYKALKEKFQNKPWNLWPEKYKNPREKDLFSWSNSLEEKLQFYTFLQYLSFSQFSKVQKQAEEKNILLIGDIPILVSYDSSDVWFYREVFSLENLAGAPPDMYNPEGQNWGFPTFNWDFLEKTDYFWWKKRIEIASQFYDLYRIDHLVGFFRIWSIKPSQKAREGRFISENRLLWPFLGKKRLEMLLSNSSMLPIAEDLGVIPYEVRPILKELGICKTIVQRWAKTEEETFLHPKDYPFLSLSTLSTHDSETLEEWWEIYPLEAQSLSATLQIPYRKKLSSSMRTSLLQIMHKSPSLFHVNLLSEYLALFYKEEGKKRINIPGTLSKKNWSYRMKPSLESLKKNTKLIKQLRSFTKGEK